MECPNCGSKNYETLSEGFKDVEGNRFNHKCLKCGAVFEKKVIIDKQVLME